MNRNALTAWGVLLLAGAACTASSTSDAPTSDGSDDIEATDDTAASIRDAGKKTTKDSGAEATCQGDCETTRAVATFGAASAVLEQAYFGFDLSGTLRVEVHGGTPTGCPTSSSAYDWSLVVAGIDPESLKANQAATLTATLFDYKGNLIESPTAKASKATLTPAVVDAESPRRFVEGELSATFAGGNVAGHVYATHCDSLDEI